MHQENIVRYWHAVELLQPQAAPKLESRSSLHAAFVHDVTVEALVPPWLPQSPVAGQKLPRNRTWSHTLYAHLYDSHVVAQALKKYFGEEQGYREQSSRRQSALFAVKFTAEGVAVVDSFVLSSEAWFLGKVLAGDDWTRGFEADQRRIRDRTQALLAGVTSGETLCELIDVIRCFLGVETFFGEVAKRRLRFRSQPIKVRKPEQEDDPLNSFLLEDLADVSDSIHQGVISAPLDQYLRRHDAWQRLHLDTQAASLPLIDRLMPDRYALGCWPSVRHLGLVHSQQLAVNTILGELADSQGLIGINGPPGTGKTTLLRDLIAAIVVRRADTLACISRASDAFQRNGMEAANDTGKPQNCYKLKPEFFGFEIVVASSNNGAVENVTLELPQRDKIDQSWLSQAEYFADLGELVTDKPAWGLISGALGSKARRRSFVERYFYGSKPSKATSEPEDWPGDEDDYDPAIQDERTGAGVAEEAMPLKMCIADDAQAVDAEEQQELSPRGFLGWLNVKAEENESKTSDQRRETWQAAVLVYQTAKEEAARIASAAARIRDVLLGLQRAREQIQIQEHELRELEQNKSNAVAELTALDTNEWKPAHDGLRQCLEHLLRHQSAVPGFWANLFSLWRTQRNWDAAHVLINSQHNLAQCELDRLSRVTDRLNKRCTELDASITKKRHELIMLRASAQSQLAEAMALATTCQAKHLIAWLEHGEIGRGDAIELAEPWAIAEWRKARARVFIEALQLHRTFFMLEAKRLRSNLFFVNGLLTGGRFVGVSRDALRSAWSSLFMVVPVLSSTFASFARSFGSLSASDIGWLLVDEAGQATPQAAVGALWRAQRAVLVGDPLQLKPIVSVSDATLEHMRTRYGVESHWLPNRQSAQSLADEATRLGRMAGPPTNKTWVGLPLMVHRRCDKPIFSLANRIAYDGTMVYGTIPPLPGNETPASLLTGWIDVSGSSQGNWVPAEGEALKRLLALLRQEGVDVKDISVVTPFKAVRDQLRRYVPRHMVAGTVHTMQGKEAAVVIIVLGGNAVGSGARDWAVSEPNLLNVAVTRAKRRLYVIGDYDDWKARALFRDVMDLLPLRQLPLLIVSKASEVTSPDEGDQLASVISAPMSPK